MVIYKLRHIVGDGAKALINKGVSENGTRPGEGDIQAILDDFLYYYSHYISDKT